MSQILQIIVSLKFKFNLASCILSGGSIQTLPCENRTLGIPSMPSIIPIGPGYPPRLCLDPTLTQTPGLVVPLSASPRSTGELSVSSATTSLVLWLRSNLPAHQGWPHLTPNSGLTAPPSS